MLVRGKIGSSYNNRKMPELPEVQTVVDDLNRLIKGCHIVDFSSLWKKNVQKGRFQYFRKQIIGQKVASVSREGKFIVIGLESGDSVVVHLRMTGALLVGGGQDASTIKYIRHSWCLDDGKKRMTLAFSDVRKFGTVDFVRNGDTTKHKGLSRLGADPMNKEFSGKVFKMIVHKYSKRTVRGLLLEQSVIAGIGNIYASEIVFDAGIHPERRCEAISDEEIQKLYVSMRKILRKAIEHRGTSISDYRDSSGKKGGFQKLLKVYNREHERCLRNECAGTIKKEKLQGRSAFWCPKCQPLVKNKKSK